MNNQEKAIAKEKKLEFLLGIFFLIPPILGVIAFVLCLFDFDSHFAKLSNLSVIGLQTMAMKMVVAVECLLLLSI